jgi:hypothetical protein
LASEAGARRQWAMIEQFIRLMSVDGMVEMMGALTPQLLDAVPLGIGTPIRAIGRTPGFLRDPAFLAMAPPLPRLFPPLLPGMMPTVPPSMIALVERRIAMPEYLGRQLPDLFPQLVDNVMPKILPEIAPHGLPVLFGHDREA